jgi:CheY-like chemotaxis protein
VTQEPIVLLVDDYQDALEMYEEYLTFRGYRVVTASSGAEAVDLARATRPALILMDLQMGGMTGTEAMQILRADPAHRDVQIVALTAHALDGDRRAALDAGFDDVLAKPCLPDELVAAIGRLLASAGSRSPGSS